ncbi:hypothetical protein HY643_01305, partial [Candidatus Woesearchaeota archaeon]|nr:hypothetical protein [Candidatus Woesearchaeota archaeon]
VYSLTIPGLQEKNTKDYVITILTEKYPLTKMQLYRETKKRGLNVTFHAVNKATNQLREDKVLSKKEKDYRLNYEWITQLRQFAEKASSKLLNEEGCLIHGAEDIKREGSVTTLTFENIYDMDRYCKTLHDYYYAKLNEGEAVCLVYSHHWWNLLYPEKEYAYNAKNKKFYCICSNNTPLDKAGGKFKKKLGMNVVYKKNAAFKDHTIYGDIIIQNVISKELKENMDHFFKKTKKVEDLNPKEFVNHVLKKKGKVIVVINQNKELAEEIKKHALSYF